MFDVVRFFIINKKYLFSIPRSLYFNFRLLNFRQGIRCPIFLSNRVVFNNLDGKITFDCQHLSTGMVKIGYPTSDFFSKADISTISISGEVVIKGPADFGAGCRVSVGKSSKLIVGSNLWITGDVLIIVRHLVEFKRHNVLSWGITIMDHDAHDIYQNDEKINFAEPIIIGEHVWIGCNSIILKGNVIPNGSIIGAGTVVAKKHTKENSIICGNPGVEKKENIFWK